MNQVSPTLTHIFLSLMTNSNLLSLNIYIKIPIRVQSWQEKIHSYAMRKKKIKKGMSCIGSLENEIRN